MKPADISAFILPAYMNVVILLLSSGGAHFDSIAAIEGYVTACACTKSTRTTTRQYKPKESIIKQVTYCDFDYITIVYCTYTET